MALCAPLGTITWLSGLHSVQLPGLVLMAGGMQGSTSRPRSFMPSLAWVLQSLAVAWSFDAKRATVQSQTPFVVPPSTAGFLGRMQVQMDARVLLRVRVRVRSSQQ